MKRKNIVLKALTCSVAALAFTACTDTWDSHYEPKPELNATETLWDLIEADPELSEFAAYAKATGYDVILDQNRAYTIWVPVNGADYYSAHSLEGITDSLLKAYQFEFVENHVADYVHNASGNMSDNQIKMLNGKYNRFEGSPSSYTFKNAEVAATNIAAKNGVLHKISNNAIFTPNIWEQLEKVDSISLLCDFLKSYDELYFDELNSVQGPTVGGEVTYLDSVVIERNEWFNRFGQINREDSSYTMFAPTNKAWREMYEKAKTYFVYETKNELADSLQDVMAKDFMVRHLVFSNTIQKSPQDSLTSYCTSTINGYITIERETFKGDELKRLYNNLVETYELSNGTLNIVDSYNYRTLWHDTLRVEGESLLGEAEGLTSDFEYAQSNKDVATISKDSVDKYYQTRNGRIGVYSPSTPTGNPTLTFTVPNVLSAKYRVKVVLVPANFINYRDTVLLPNKFNATLKYRDVTGKSKSLVMGKDIISDPTKVDTITLIPNKAEEGVDYFEFPVNEYLLGTGVTPMTELEIKGRVGSRETEFDRVLRIDQIYLEPVTEE